MEDGSAVAGDFYHVPSMSHTSPQYLYNANMQQHHHHHAEPYRDQLSSSAHLMSQASPLPSHGSNNSNGNMRTHAHFTAPTMNGAPHPSQTPPYPPPTSQLLVPPYPMPSSVVPSAPNGSARYPIPHDSRQLANSRHKKEIKRRTKTGCITCRKRRIKCDEAQPHCHNCEKSKRDCLGYDPIFKQPPGPAHIQPAPLSVGSPLASQPSASPLLPSHQYQTSAVYPGAAQATADSRPEYNVSLDPALAGQPNRMAQPRYAPLQSQRSVKPVVIEELFSLNDIQPHFTLREAPPPISAATSQEIEQLYKFHYANGLDRFFESDWYSRQGVSLLQHDAVLQDFVAQSMDQFRNSSDDSSGKALVSLEARLVWQLAALPRSASAAKDATVDELLPRLDAIESLLTGQYLPSDRVPSPPQAPPPSSGPHQDPTSNQKYNELSFWHHLGRFVSIRDDSAGPTILGEIDKELNGMRGILNTLESRDVLYSIAMLRHLGGRMADFHPSRHLVASSNDKEDEVNKLKVAHHFVEGEEQRGMTQVIQRMCSMALRGSILQKQ